MRCQNRFSLGAVYMTEKVPYEKLFKEADSVLYEVKTRGKNSFEKTPYKAAQQHIFSHFSFEIRKI